MRLKPQGRLGWLSFFRPGDVFLCLSFAVLLAFCLPLAFRGGAGDMAQVRLAGKVVKEVRLDHAELVRVKGPIGETVVEIEKGRARVASDPGIHQYCVRQGWLSRAGAIAICAPNEVSLSIAGKEAPYDTLNY
jgi:hypothetical protein